MSEVCCDLCAYWLPQFKECGNTHTNKCINKEHFVKVERNCGTCEREIRAKAIDEFADKMIIMMPGHRQDIEQIAEQLKAGGKNENNN